MNKKDSLILIILKSLVSPFSLLVLFSSIVSLVGSFFLGKGYSDGLILFVIYLALVVLHFVVYKKVPELKEKTYYKNYIELSKIVGCLALFAVAIIVISSLLRQLDIPSIIRATSLPFIIGLPLGLLPLFLLIKDKEDEAVENAFNKCASELLPILVTEFLITITMPIIGIGFAFNSNELIVINFVIVCLAYFFDFLEMKKGNKTAESHPLGQKVLLRGVVIGFFFTFVLLAIYLIAPFKELMDSNLSFNINNVRLVLNNEVDVYSSAQCYMFVALSFGIIIYLYFFSNMISEIFDSKRFIRSILYLAAILIIVVLIFVPWIKTFIYSSYMSIIHIIFALLGGLLLSVFVLIYKSIEKKVSNNKKSD